MCVTRYATSLAHINTSLTIVSVFLAHFIYRFRKFDVTKREQRQRLIDSFVNVVYLYEDKIILTFNYKDGSKTITLEEVEGSDLSVLGAPS